MGSRKPIGRGARLRGSGVGAARRRWRRVSRCTRDKARDTDTKKQRGTRPYRPGTERWRRRFEQSTVEVGGHGAIPATLPETVLALETLFPHGLDRASVLESLLCSSSCDSEPGTVPCAKSFQLVFRLRTQWTRPGVVLALPIHRDRPQLRQFYLRANFIYTDSMD